MQPAAKLGLAALIVGTASIVVSGCGPFGSSESAPTGYLTHGSDAAVFLQWLQWTRVGDSLTGTWTEAYIHPSDPTQVHALQQNVSGTINGSSVTLTFGSGTIDALSGKVVTGTFSSPGQRRPRFENSPPNPF